MQSFEVDSEICDNINKNTETVQTLIDDTSIIKQSDLKKYLQLFCASLHHAIPLDNKFNTTDEVTKFLGSIGDI